MDHHVTVDGLEHFFESVDHGGADVEVHARCLPESTEIGSIDCGRISYFGTGVHHVVAWSTVVGYPAELEAAEFEVELDCKPESDGSDQPGTGRGGCSLSHSSHRGAPLLFLAALFGATALARRKLW